MGVSENRGTSFWGPHNKDPTIRVLYRVSYFGETPILALIGTLEGTQKVTRKETGIVTLGP